jgi:hypothetical protein
MYEYFIDRHAQPNGDHEVHRSGCSCLPADRDSLGEHIDCHAALAAADGRYPQANGCFWCCRECHST